MQNVSNILHSLAQTQKSHVSHKANTISKKQKLAS